MCSWRVRLRLLHCLANEAWLSCDEFCALTIRKKSKAACTDWACVCQHEHSLLMNKLKERFKQSSNKGIRSEVISSYCFAVRTITASGFQSGRPLCPRAAGDETLFEFDWLKLKQEFGHHDSQVVSQHCECCCFPGSLECGKESIKSYLTENIHSLSQWKTAGRNDSLAWSFWSFSYFLSFIYFVTSSSKEK